MVDGSREKAETAADFGTDDSAIARRWITEIGLYEREFADWAKRGKKILRRYRDERGETLINNRRFSLLWSNVQVLQPIVYGRLPRADVQRRYRDNDDVARVAAEILERALDYYLDKPDFDRCLKMARDDYLLPGRGVVWQSYTALRGPLRNDDGEAVLDEDSGEPVEEVISEDVLDEYVLWEDFGHTPGARTWEEVTAVWKRCYMTRSQLVARFGKEIGSQVPLDYAPKGLKKDNPEYELFKKACVYEIVDRTDGRWYWINKAYGSRPLDVKDDPLGLGKQFPCPRPIFATLTTNSLIPVPDYCQYQDQAEEIDDLTQRIGVLQTALQMRGLYAGHIDEVKRLFTEAGNTELIPVENWQQFEGSGGLKNAVLWMPVAEVAQTLLACFEARAQIKLDAQEITGLSDIIRGQSEASETATAQQLKSQWGSVRTRDRQKDMAEFIRDILRIKAVLITRLLSAEKIAEIANVQSFPESDMQFIRPALELLKSPRELSFRVDIETDSTVYPDEQEEKQSRIEFVTAVTSFAEKWGPMIMQAPPMIPLAKDLLLFASRGFKAGAQLEGSIEQAFEQLGQMAAQAQPADPMAATRMEIEADMAKAQAQQQIDREKMQGEMAMEQQRLVVDTEIQREKAATDMQLSREKAQQQAQVARFTAQQKARQPQRAA